MIETRNIPRLQTVHQPGPAAAVCIAVCCVLLMVCGCASRGNLDVLEARLRHQEDQLFALQSQLEQAQGELVVARKEAEGLRAQLSSQGQSPMLPEQARVLYRAEGIRFNSLLTGGLDTDGIPGDDLISAVLAPHDADGDLVKLPGKFEIELLDLSQPQERQRIGSWEFPLDESHQYWHRGLVGSGYLFRLPWQETPTSSDLLLHARMTTPDQRKFDTTIQVEIETGGVPQPRELFLEDQAVPEPETEPESPIQRTTFRLEETPDSPADVESFENAGPMSKSSDRTLPAETPLLRTSDSWTDATIPQYR